MNLYRCDDCGAVVKESSLGYLKTLGGRSGHYDDWIPDEYVSVCPECGADDCMERISEDQIEQESFQSAANPEPVL